MSPIQPKARGRQRGERTPFWFGFSLAGVTLPVSAVFKLRWHEQQHIPLTGGAIVVVNHISYADPLVVGRYVYDAGRLPRFLAKDSLFDVPAVGAAMRGMGQVPVHRGGADAQEALSSAVRALRRGEVIIVYPEGTVTRDPQWWPRPGKTGAARLAVSAPEIPVIPLGQWGAQNAIDVYGHRYKVWPRQEAHVTAGPPLDLSRWRGAGQAPTADVLRAITRTMMGAITANVAVLRAEPAPVRTFTTPPPAARPDA